jgi:hypothetical protein
LPPNECGCACPEGQKCLEDGRCECPSNEVSFEGTCQKCPAPPGIGLPGSACPDGICSCGGECCGQENDCFYSYNRVGEPIDEFCCRAGGGSVCNGECCQNADCEKQGCVRRTARGWTYRRPGR